MGSKHGTAAWQIRRIQPDWVEGGLTVLNAIETNDLTKRFRRLKTYRDLLTYSLRRDSHTAVEGVSVGIRQGELFGLLGENGAGKSTFIRMLSTALVPTAGTASVGGYDVVRAASRVRQIIGVVTSEERSFYWRLTGRENLEFFAALYHLPRQLAKRRIDVLVDRLGVAAHADRTFQAYSTGTRQRFAIARGLLTEPTILFLDEPTRSLDPLAAMELRSYVRDHIIRELGCTVVLATHSLQEAEAICDRISIIRRGRLVALGTMPELRAEMNLSTIAEISLTGWADGLLETLRAIPGVLDISHVVAGDRVHVIAGFQPSDGTLGRLLATVLNAGVRVDACTTREPGLDEIYRAVLGGWARVAPEAQV